MISYHNTFSKALKMLLISNYLWNNFNILNIEYKWIRNQLIRMFVHANPLQKSFRWLLQAKLWTRCWEIKVLELPWINLVSLGTACSHKGAWRVKWRKHLWAEGASIKWHLNWFWRIIGILNVQISSNRLSFMFLGTINYQVKMQEKSSEIKL